VSESSAARSPAPKSRVDRQAGVPGVVADSSVVAVHVWPAEAELPVPVPSLDIDWGGIVGDRHHGLTMASDTRQHDVYPRGTQIRNHRQVSIVDVAELAQISAALGLAEIAPGTIADNICTEGLPDLTSLPPLSRLVFSSGVVLMTGGFNSPCVIAGAMVQERYGAPASRFPKAAIHRRGITAWVERPGRIVAGDGVRVVLPTGM
jgi:hypothetical protein